MLREDNVSFDCWGEQTMLLKSKLKLGTFPFVMATTLVLGVALPWYAQAEDASVAGDVSTSTPSEPSAQPAVPKTNADRPGSVQAGVQILVNKLVEGMKLSDDGSFTRIAVLPFEAASQNEDERHLGKVSAALLSSRLGAQPSIMQVERDRLDTVLAELKKTERGAINPKGAVSVGKLLGASNVVLGSVAPSGAEFLLTARVVDSETGRIVSIADHSFPRSNLVAFSKDVVEVKSKTGAAIRSMVFPGWGQYYNGDVQKGAAIGVVFVGVATAAAASAALAADSVRQYNRNEASTVQYRQDANEHYDTTNTLLYSMAGLWALASIEAYWNGRDAADINLDNSGPANTLLGGRF